MVGKRYIVEAVAVVDGEERSFGYQVNYPIEVFYVPPFTESTNSQVKRLLKGKKPKIVSLNDVVSLEMKVNGAYSEAHDDKYYSSYP